jgi:8-oxo-dGTP pyrophosphatase MutT (NUDIX family)
MSGPPSAAGPAKRPRDAATLVIIDWSDSEPRILMGRRRMDQVFLPGHYVFPGGRVDPQDRKTPVASQLQPEHSASLMLRMPGQPSVKRANTLALAAVRETFEETGLLIGQPSNAMPTDAGQMSWRQVLDSGAAPSLGELVYFARAITPPGRPRRYDTRFFAVTRQAVSGPHGPGDGELEDLGWRTVSEVRSLKLPSVTRLILQDLNQLLETSQFRGGNVQPQAGTAGIPFYFQRNGVFQRVVLSRAAGAP